MHKIISAIILLALTTASTNVLSDNDKKRLCHKGKDISVASSAVSAHRNHGDTLGSCDDDDYVVIRPPQRPETISGVVMMRCEAQEGDNVQVVSASSSPHEGIQPGEDCPAVIAGLLDEGYGIRSITSGSAEAGDGRLHLYTDYLLLGKILVDEDEASIDD